MRMALKSEVGTRKHIEEFVLKKKLNPKLVASVATNASGDTVLWYWGLDGV